MSIFCSISFHQNAWTVLPSWNNRLSKSKTNKPCNQFAFEMIQMFLSFQFSSERLKIALGIDFKNNVTRILTWHEHWTYRATILLSRRRVQRIITPKILRIVRAVHFKLQQIITSQVLDKLDERRIDLQIQTSENLTRDDVMWQQRKWRQHSRSLC